MGYAQGELPAQGALKVNFFANIVDAEAPNLLLAGSDRRGKPLQLNFKTQTYDIEVGDSRAARHDSSVLTLRRQRPPQQLRHHHRARRRRTAPRSAPIVQDEIFFDRFRFTLGGRVDKFGNLERSGVLAAARGDVQAGDRTTRSASRSTARSARRRSSTTISTSRSSCPVDLERAGAAAAAAAAAARRGAVPAGGERGRQRAADRSTPQTS